MSGQQAVTEFVRGADGPVTNEEVAEATGLPQGSVNVYLGRAVKRGDLQRLTTGAYAHTEYAVERVEMFDELTDEQPLRVEGVVAQEGIASGDGRMIERGAITWDGVLPAPLIFDLNDSDHTGMVVGSVVELERRPSGVEGVDDIWAAAHLSRSDVPEVQAAVTRTVELFAEGAVGVSIKLDDDVHEVRVKKELLEEQIMPLDGDTESATGAETEDGRVVVYSFAADDYLDVTTAGRFRHLAVVDTAALLTDPEKRLAIAASGALTTAEWAGYAHYFDDPRFGAPGTDDRLRYDPGTGQWSCPPTVDGDRVYGHVAAWGYCLRGRPDRCVTPPDGDLETFMRAYAPAAGGKRTGVICVGGGHAKTGVGAAEATRYYDSTGRAVADVRVGRDQYGVWFAGMVRPGAAKEDVYTFAASDVSGHWEPDQSSGRFRLCGLPAVNVGGFPKGVYTYQEVLQGLAAAASLDDCGCDENAHMTAGPLGFVSELFERLDRLEMALAPLYAKQVLEELGDD